jgi:L1 cell adhesion molecule like protein
MSLSSKEPNFYQIGAIAREGQERVNANGILNVSAIDKSSGKEKQITITNDKERLAKDEIDRMIADAENYEKEDEIPHHRICAKNLFESYCFNRKARINDEN